MTWLDALLIITPVGLTAAASAVVKLGMDLAARRRSRAADSYGYVCCRPGVLVSGAALGRCHVDESQQVPRHEAPNGEPVCCGQGLVAWPHPCPWHPANGVER